MSIIENSLPVKTKQHVFKKAIKTKGYLELCEKNLVAADEKISMESPEHFIINSMLKDIRSAASSINTLIARTKHDTLTD